MAGITANYISPSVFTIETDRTIEFCTDRRVKADCGVDGFKFGTITSSSYGDPNTTVNLTAASDDLTSNLTEVYYGLVSEGLSGSVPVHSHNGDEGSGGISDVASHNIASHSDTTATGTELEELTDGSDTTLHDHDGISENTDARHTRSHTMISTDDHTAGNYKLFASNGSGEITEITHGALNKVLTGQGVAVAPSWEDAPGGEWSTHQTFEDSTLSTITSAAPSASWDLETNQITTLELDYSGTLMNPTNKSSTGHAIYTLIVINNGSYTLSFDTEYLFVDGEAPTITESGTDILTFICNGTNMYGGAAQNFS